MRRSLKLHRSHRRHTITARTSALLLRPACIWPIQHRKRMLETQLTRWSTTWCIIRWAWGIFKLPTHRLKHNFSPSHFKQQTNPSELNHTNDGFLNSILNDEDLQLMDMAVNEGNWKLRFINAIASFDVGKIFYCKNDETSLEKSKKVNKCIALRFNLIVCEKYIAEICYHEILLWLCLCKYCNFLRKASKSLIWNILLHLRQPKTCLGRNINDLLHKVLILFCF